MRLLIITQKVDKDDPILGFFHAWIMEFAKHCEMINVICLQEGKHQLPVNVKVYSLGKEKGASRAGFVVRFYQLIWNLRNEYNTVFVHMNPEYVVLGAPLWKLLHKKIALWYVHRQVDTKLRWAERFSDVIFTSSKESFGIESKKVRYVGHGIEIEKFVHIPEALYSPLTIVHVGRITRIKNLATIIKALKYLIDDKVYAVLHLVGEPVTLADNAYKAELQLLIKGLQLEKSVIWEGVLPNVEAFAKASITVNAAPDGGMDKVVLESLAASRAVFVSNKAFREAFGAYEKLFLYEKNNSQDLANKIKSFTHKESFLINLELSNVIKTDYDLTKLISKILDILNQSVSSL